MHAINVAVLDRTNDIVKLPKRCSVLCVYVCVGGGEGGH